MGVKEYTYIFVGATFSLYLVIAWISRVRTTKGFYVAGQGIPALANGMATGADWMSAASFISMAGIISFMGFAGGQYLMGWTGGYVLLALLLAPYLRKFGHFTVPDFVGDRYSSNTARIVAVLCAIFVSFTYVAGQMRGVGIVFSRFLEVDVTVGVIIGMAIVFIYATLGGMKGITWTQVAQYWVLITAFLIPAIAISIKLTGVTLPQIGMGSALTQEQGVFLLDKLSQINQDLGFSNYTNAPGYAPSERTNLLNLFCVTVALMAGTAGLPHVIVRFYTVKNVKAARWSAFWALLFIAMLYLTAPAVAAFARYYMIDTIRDRQYQVDLGDSPSFAEDDGRMVKTADGASYYRIEPDADDKTKNFYSQIPHWFHNWEKTGLILWLDDGDGKVVYYGNVGAEELKKNKQQRDKIVADAKAAGKEAPKDTDWKYTELFKKNEVFRTGKMGAVEVGKLRVDHQMWIDTQGKQGIDGRKTLRDKGLAGPDRDIIVLATPEMAELASWIIALVAAGGLAAALSTASGLLLVISSSIAHDVYARMINPKSSEAKRLLVGRGVIGVAVVIAGLFGIYPPGFVSQVVAFAFGLAASSFFPIIVLGIFSKRVGTIPAVTGMIVGIGFTGTYIIGTVYGGWDNWFFGIKATGIGTIGMVLNFVVTLGLTPFTPAPSQEVQDMVESIREPEGADEGTVIEEAVGH
jgi:cation/acetate symporter